MPRKRSTTKAANARVSKGSAKPKASKDSDLKKQLLFLWTCHKVSNAHIDIPAVAQHFGIRNNAAQMRFTRLKKKIEAMEVSPNSGDNIHDTKFKDEEQDEDDSQIKEEEQNEDEDQDETQIEEQISDDDAEVEEQIEVKSESV